MFSGLGIMEILIIAGVALVVLGPDKFPQFAKISIRMFREIRGYWEDAKQDISKELRPLNKEVRELKHYKPEDYIDSLIGDDEDEVRGRLLRGGRSNRGDGEADTEREKEEGIPGHGSGVRGSGGVAGSEKHHGKSAMIEAKSWIAPW